MRLGLLDIGSTAARLELVDLDQARMPRAVWSHKAKTRLAEHTRPDGHVTEAGAQQAAEAVAECVRAAQGRLSGPLVAFGTAAVRDAANSGELRRELARAAGTAVGTLSPHAEAALCFQAARRWHGREHALLTTVDIGGGTAEIAAGCGEQPARVVSTPLGAARLTREHRLDDPPAPEQVRTLRQRIEQVAATELGPFAGAELGHVVAQSKVLRQLAVLAASSDHKLVRHPDHLVPANLRRWIPRLAELPHAERAKLPGVSRGRARRILAGAITADVLLRTIGAERAELCPWGLREGLVFRFAEAYERAERQQRADAVRALVAEMFV